MDITLEQLISFGYLVPAAPVDAWRTYDEQAPIPNYFDFDWLSSRHPDLYHKFALSTVGLMHELDRLVDLSGLDVLEVAAGTGRAAIEAGKKAHRLTAIDIFPSVVYFGKEMVRQAGLGNVDYARADCNHLPFPDGSFDACIASWAILSITEAYRVLKPGGYLIWLGAAPGALCGELTATLASLFPEIITEIASDELYAAGCPDSDAALQDATWNGLQVTPPTLLHDFTYTADYGDCLEAAAIFGRLYGPAARRYMLDRQQSKFSWRLRIEIVRVSK